jgi:hypothetical protein
VNRQEAIDRFFEQIRAQIHGKTKPTPEIIRDAAAAIGDTSEINDVILGYAQGWGINPEKELAELYAAREEARAAQKEEARREAQNKTATGAAALLATIEGETNSAKRTEIFSQVGKLIAAEQGAARGKSPFITFDEYIDSLVNRRYWEEYSPSLFNNLPFPDGTFSAIGAAPGSGKSAALVNLARELLVTTPTNSPNPTADTLKNDINAKRKILLISAEMTAEDILTRLIHCIAWQIGNDNPNYSLSTVDHTNIDYWKAASSIMGKAPPWQTYGKEEYNRQTLYKSVWEQHIRPSLGGRLNIAYVRGLRTFEDITNIIKARAEPGTLVLMDYLQLFPPVTTDIEPDGGESGCPRYLQIRHIIDEAILAAEQTKSVIIAAAQLGRTERQGGSSKNADDTQGWRESGDIEQSAWNLVKLFLEWNEDAPVEKQLSYRVSKCRSSGKLGEAYILDWVPSYQYMNITDKTKQNPPWIQKKPDEKRRTSATGSKRIQNPNNNDDERDGFPV